MLGSVLVRRTDTGLGPVSFAFIVASGAAIGTQISGVIAFVAGMLAVVEITLVSYLVVPAKTQVIVQGFHD
ncbi:GAP family protein [Mycobacterium xenopi]|uniref:Uncharacterized protein n=1 Tax=Mycobacterium xenopi TaxID=1789 RepID=A0AAD1GWA4_MYCXE|nr:GAP family protein [Mycobacterium xenopi]EID18037.1 hypothetical protein MXEN_00060 [Mycobacterium xenopi RIVM700367]MDA3641837.1 GAP family protein [Mycobacterium xenopi]MDA3659826.1 GAP family protein [Mycobacterium xenopi]ORX13584.1 hypothetical protein AWC32_15145 [Mycobacterium xenopi]SPX79659.1 Protein of uncharacterised function (DUF2910) [Mycobacterium xenopi]